MKDKNWHGSIVKLEVANLSSTVSNSLIKMLVVSNTHAKYPYQAWKNILIYSVI